MAGGIDGAIANYYLSKKYNIALVDKSRFGYACTSCATALLEYQLDEYSKDLQKYLSKNEISMIYQMGLDSIQKIENFISLYGNLYQFSKRLTLLFSSKQCEIKNLEEEYKFRIENYFGGEDEKFKLKPINEKKCFKVYANLEKAFTNYSLN